MRRELAGIVGLLAGACLFCVFMAVSGARRESRYVEEHRCAPTTTQKMVNSGYMHQVGSVSTWVPTVEVRTWWRCADGAPGLWRYVDE